MPGVRNCGHGGFDDRQPSQADHLNSVVVPHFSYRRHRQAGQGSLERIRVFRGDFDQQAAQRLAKGGRCLIFHFSRAQHVGQAEVEPQPAGQAISAAAPARPPSEQS